MLAANLFAAHELGAGGFGLLTLLQTVVTFLAGIAALGLGVALTRRVAELRVTEPERVQPTIHAVLRKVALVGLALACSCALASPLVHSAVLSRGSAALVLLAAPTVLGSAVLSTAQGALLGQERFTLFACSQLAQGLAVGCGLAAGAAVAGVNGAAAGASAGWLVAAVTASLLVRTPARPANAAPADLQPLWGAALPALFAFVSIYVALLVAQLVLSRRSGGFQELGVFNVAYRWHLAILAIPSAIAPIALPLLTRMRTAAQQADERDVLHVNISVNLLATLLPALLLALLAGPVMGLSGSHYRAHPAPLVLLAIAAVPSALNSVLSSRAISIGAMRLWLWSDIALAGVLVVTASALVGSGAAGLAIAYLAAFVATDTVLVPVVRDARPRS